MTTLAILAQRPDLPGHKTRSDKMAHTAPGFAAIFGATQNGSETAQVEKPPQGLTSDHPHDGVDANQGQALEGHKAQQPGTLRAMTDAGEDPSASGETLQPDPEERRPSAIFHAQEYGALDGAREMTFPMLLVDGLSEARSEPGFVRVDLQKLIWSGRQNPEPRTDHAPAATWRDRCGAHLPEQGVEPDGRDLRPGSAAITPKPITTSTENAEQISLETDQAGLPGDATEPELDVQAGIEGFERDLSIGQVPLSARPSGIAESPRIAAAFQEGAAGLPKVKVPPSETVAAQASPFSTLGEAATEVLQTVLGSPGSGGVSTVPPGVSLPDAIAVHRGSHDPRATREGARSPANTANGGRIPPPTAGLETDVLQDRMLFSTRVTQDYQGEDEPPAQLMSGRVDQATLGAVSLRDPMSPAPVLTALAQRLGEALRQPDQRVIQIQLAPAELGRLRIILSPTETGIHLVIQSERPETQDLLRRNLGELARDLADLGFQDLSFDFSDQQERADLFQSSPRANASHNSFKVDLLDPLTAPAESAATCVGGLDLRV